MIAAKAFDPVVGVDIHMIQPPGPVPPVPIPHPFVGMLVDPMDFAPVIGATVMVNGMPRATAGTAGKCIPPHIPIGGVFIKPPTSECEVFMGSATVLADGDPLSRLAMPALSCHDIGMPSPPRVKKKSTPKSLELPTSVVLAVPKGMPVLVGGPPTISMMALGMKAAMAGLGGALKKLKKLKAVKNLMKKFKKARQKAFKNMKPGFLKCKVLKAEPIDVRTGEVVIDQIDFDLDWPVPLTWSRNYRSSRKGHGQCGWGWETLADARLEIDEDDLVVFHDGTGGVTVFPAFPAAQPVGDLVDGAVLAIDGNVLLVRRKTGETYTFARPGGADRIARIQTVANAAGRELRFIWSAAGLVEIRSDFGPVIRATTQDNRIASLTLVHPAHSEPVRLVHYSYDPPGDLRAAHDALDQGLQFRYEHHCLIQQTTRKGLSFYYKYDQAGPGGRVIQTWGDHGLYAYRFEYQSARRVIADSLGAVTTIELDNDGLPVREFDGLGGVTEYEYDAAGRTSAVVDPLGLRTSYEYDGLGNLLKCVRPDDTLVQFKWSTAGLLETVADPNGNAWKQEWSPSGLLTAKVDPAGNAWRFLYGSSGLLAGEVNPLGGTTRYVRDQWGRVIEQIDALGRTTRYEYDALDEITAVTFPSGGTTRIARDAKGRPRVVTLPSGSKREFVFDADDNLVAERSGNGDWIRYEVFGLGEVARRTESDGSSWSYHYDTEERLIGTTDPLGRRRTFERDLLGRVVREYDPWGCVTEYTYDAAGRVREAKDPLAHVTQFEYDNMGRLTSSRAPDGTVHSFSYDANGNLVLAKSDVVEVVRHYDVRNQLVSEQAGDEWIRSAYDQLGNRIRRESSAGNVVSYKYNECGEAVLLDINGRHKIELIRDNAGRVAAEQFALNLRRVLRYDADDDLVQAELRHNGRALSTVDYVYDEHRQLVSRRHGANGIERLFRDPTGRVSSYEAADGTSWKPERDATGSLLIDHHVQVKPVWKRHVMGEDVACMFDACGNLIECKHPDSKLDLTWDADNRLSEARVDGRVVAVYRYDALGRRVEKRSPESHCYLVWDDEHPCIERFGGEPSETVYLPGTFEPAAVIQGGAVYFCDREPNGAALQLLDPEGNARWGCHYLPTGRGAVTSGSSLRCSLRLQGQVFDEETGFAYNGQRYFDPASERFISQDPLGLEAGDDPYEYGISIVEWIDPLGLSCRPKRKQVFAHFPTRNRAKNARPRPKPHKPKAQRTGKEPLTRQQKNKIGTGNNPDSIHKPGQDPHFHDDAHTNPDRPNVHYSYPK